MVKVLEYLVKCQEISYSSRKTISQQEIIQRFYFMAWRFCRRVKWDLRNTSLPIFLLRVDPFLEMKLQSQTKIKFSFRIMITLTPPGVLPGGEIVIHSNPLFLIPLFPFFLLLPSNRSHGRIEHLQTICTMFSLLFHSKLMFLPLLSF